jgi:hypothetical protein
MVRAEDEDVEHKKLISFIFRFYSESISRFSTSRQSLARRFAYLLSNNVRNTTYSLSFALFFFPSSSSGFLKPKSLGFLYKK